MKKTVFIFTSIYMILVSECMGFSAIAHQTPSTQLASNVLVAQNSNNNSSLNLSRNKSQDNLTKIMVLISLIGTGALFWYLSQSRQPIKSNFKLNNNSETALLDRVSPRLRRQLLRLINDPKTANRLLIGIHKNNSDRSPDWLADKAIYDLKRGR